MFHLSREGFLDDTGATTEEGIIMITMASFAMLLLMVVHSDSVREGVAGLVERALALSG